MKKKTDIERSRASTTQGRTAAPDTRSRWEPPWGARFDVWIVLAAALVVRMVYLLEVRVHDPFYAATLAGFDQATYQKQAAAILDGDWLLSSWKRFYYSPIYAYFCALVFRIGGRGNFDLLHGLQALIGAGTCVLLWGFARRYLDRAEALIAAGLGILCRPWLFYEQLLLLEGLSLFFNLATLVLICAPESDGTWKKWRLFLAGAAAALAFTARGNFLAVLLPMPIWIAARSWLSSRGAPLAWRRIVVALAVFLAGVWFVLAPIAWRNHHVAEEWAVGTTNGPALLYLGNAADADGTFTYSPRFSDAMAKVASDPGIYTKMLREDLRNTPLPIAANLLRKTYYFWNAWDIPDNTNIYLGRAFSHMLRWTPVTERLLFVLGLTGMALSLRRFRSESFPWLYAAIFSASIILIVPVGRYRIPIFAVLCLFAARAVCWFVDSIQTRRLVAIVAALAGIIALCWITAPFPRELIRRQDYSTFLRMAIERRRIASADRLADWALRDYPAAGELRILRFRHFVASEQWPRARDEARLLRQMTALTPEAVIAQARLSFHDGQTKEARKLLESLLKARPDHGEARQILAEMNAAEAGSKQP